MTIKDMIQQKLPFEDTLELKTWVEKIPTKIGKDFVKKHHYARGIHNGPMCYGLFNDGELIGVCAFATPCSENVCASVFGLEHKRRVTELHRLVLLDKAPRNSESWFIVRAIKELKKDKPDYWAVLSFADSTQGHLGIIYQATNAIYSGTSSSAIFYKDKDGRLRHPRQNGKNISKKEALDMGWTSVKRLGKHRYLYLIPNNRGHKKYLRSILKLQALPYPKSKNILENQGLFKG